MTSAALRGPVRWDLLAGPPWATCCGASLPGIALRSTAERPLAAGCGMDCEPQGWQGKAAPRERRGVPWSHRAACVAWVGGAGEALEDTAVSQRVSRRVMGGGRAGAGPRERQGRKRRARHGGRSGGASSRRCGSTGQNGGCKAHREGDLSHTVKVTWGGERRRMLPCFHVLLGDGACAAVTPRRTRASPLPAVSGA